MAFFAFLIVIAIYFGMVLLGSLVVTAALSAMVPGYDAPFWPVFWILVVLIVFVKGGSHQS